jgi:hypothetical protein
MIYVVSFEHYISGMSDVRQKKIFVVIVGGWDKNQTLETHTHVGLLLDGLDEHLSTVTQNLTLPHFLIPGGNTRLK